MVSSEGYKRALDFLRRYSSYTQARYLIGQRCKQFGISAHFSSLSFSFPTFDPRKTL